MNRTSIKDLAKLLSLNISTVSRALSDHPDVKVETKKRVQAAALEFNYVPNLHARYFRKKRSGLVALILPEVNMFFVPGLMEGITRELETKGQDVIVFISNNQLKKEIEIITHCLSWVVDGVLISLSEETTNLDHLQGLKNSGIPIVLIDKVIETQDFSTVTIDDFLAGYTATKYLIDTGCNSILGIFGNPSLEITKRRLAGYKAALEDGKIEHIPPQYCHFYDKTVDERQVDKFIKDHTFDSAFIMSDELVLATFKYIQQCQKYNDRFTLFCISEGLLLNQLYDNIYYIKHSGVDVGKAAAQLLSEMSDDLAQVKHYKVATQIIMN